MKVLGKVFIRISLHKFFHAKDISGIFISIALENIVTSDNVYLSIPLGYVSEIFAIVATNLKRLKLALVKCLFVVGYCDTCMLRIVQFSN